MATYTPPSLDEPGGWEFTDSEWQQETDRHFAYMCEADDTVGEAFCADARGDDWPDKTRELGRMLNEYRHAKRQRHNNHADLLMLSVGKFMLEHAHKYIEELARDKAEGTIVDNQVYGD